MFVLIIVILTTTISANINSINQITNPNEIKSNIIKSVEQINIFNEKTPQKNVKIEALKPQNISKEINPEEDEIKNYFQKVAEVPYIPNYTSTTPKKPAQFWKDNYGDCDDKSTAFADYLYKRGAKNIKMVSITHESQEYAHACVMWNDRIFDPTAKPPIYNMEQEKYFNFLLKQGFNFRATYTYTPT
ncbi:hypothetical protein J2749_002191 [Methanobacterium oryzae]